MVYWGYMPYRTANAQGRHALLKALELNEMLAEAHSVLAATQAMEFDWKGAEREFLRALELDPESADVRHLYGFKTAVGGPGSPGGDAVHMGMKIQVVPAALDREDNARKSGWLGGDFLQHLLWSLPGRYTEQAES